MFYGSEDTAELGHQHQKTSVWKKVQSLNRIETNSRSKEGTKTLDWNFFYFCFTNLSLLLCCDTHFTSLTIAFFPIESSTIHCFRARSYCRFSRFCFFNLERMQRKCWNSSFIPGVGKNDEKTRRVSKIQLNKKTEAYYTVIFNCRYIIWIHVYRQFSSDFEFGHSSMNSIMSRANAIDGDTERT